MARLVKQKYVRIERDRRGIRVFVLNPKKFRVSAVQHSKSGVSVGKSNLECRESQHSKRGYAPRNKDTYEKLLRNNLTKLLKNNNTAFPPDFSTVENRRELQEQTERQRLLQEQKKAILEKYPPKEQSGQVIAIRKEATA